MVAEFIFNPVFLIFKRKTKKNIKNSNVNFSLPVRGLKKFASFASGVGMLACCLPLVSLPFYERINMRERVMRSMLFENV